eukprot:6460293-Amphidinium_carterae.1
MISVTEFSIETNRFAGTLPDRGMQAMMAMTFCAIEENCFTGMLPGIGLREITELYIFTNRFAGTLLLSIRQESKKKKSFAGTLPDRGMQTMMSVTEFKISHLRNRYFCRGVFPNP